MEQLLFRPNFGFRSLLRGYLRDIRICSLAFQLEQAHFFSGCFVSSCLKDERPAGAGLIMSSFRRMLNMVSWSSFLTNFIRDLEQNSFWNESHPNITDEGSISSHGCLNFGRIMAASRHPWLETEPKYHVNSRPLYLTIKKIYCLDHSVKGKIYYARNFF